MKKAVHHHGSSLRTWMTVLAALALMTTPAYAQGPGVASDFGIDGNLLSNSPGSPFDTADDWVPGTNPQATAVLDNAGNPIDSNATVHVIDLVGSADLSIFDGSNKVFDDPNTYAWKAGKPPQKDDINHALFHTRIDPNGDVWIIMAGDRLFTNGASYIDFSLLQSSLVKNPDGTFTSMGPDAGRTVGDLLLTLELTKGGDQATFYVQRWEADAGAALGFTYHDITTTPGEAYAAANIDSTVWVPYSAFGSTTYAINQFAEGALNLSRLLQSVDPCIDIPTLFVRTKSSASPTAELKDFVDPVPLNLSTNPDANAGPDKELTCSVTSVTLDGSSTTPGITFAWTVYDGGHIVSGGNTLTPLVDEPGTYVLTVTSQQGCVSADTADVTENTTPPDVNAGADISLICEATEVNLSGTSTTPGATYSWTTLDGHIVSGANTLTPLVDATGTYTLTVTDPSNGCTASDDVVVTIAPDEDPPVITCPIDVTLECGSSTDPSNTGTATATDDCDETPDITYSDAETPGSCPYELTIVRTWTATDDAGNTATCDQTITITDDIAPLVTCPDDVTVECEADVPAPDVATVIGSDNCGGTVTITHVGDSPLSGGPCGGTITRTYRGTDECGNFTDCTQTITVNDTQKPYFTFCPADLDLECGDTGNDAAIAAWLASATAADQCDANVQITNNYDAANFSDDCGETGSQLVTFTATDDCGNSETCTATVTIRDTQKPYFTFCPADLDLECGDTGNDAAIAAWLATATAADQCDADVQITDNYDPLSFTDDCGATGSQLVTFTATDDCGNTETCTATITIRDTQKPYFIFCPDDLPLACGAPGNAAAISGWLASASAADQCDADVQITDNFDPANFTDECGATGSQLVTFTATDDCGNTETCQASIIITDTEKPYFTFCPDDLILECGDTGNEAAISAWLATASAMDQCDPDVQVTDNYDPLNFSDECGETGSQLVTFTATDDCGNQETCQASIIIRDTQKPYFTFCAADLELQCGDPGNAGAIGGWLNSVTAADQCDPDVQIDDDFDLGRLSGGCSFNTGSLLVTWTATDDCGNTEICQATLTIVDNLKPNFTFCPADLELECGDPGNDAAIASWLETATATDQCQLDIQVQNNYDPANFTDECGETGSQLVTFTATDDCGNQEICQASIIIRDTQKPYFTFCAANLELQCGDPGNAGAIGGWLNSVTAADQCDPDVQITDDFDLGRLSGGCSFNTGSLLVTWTATDACGNTEICQATLTIVDNLKPNFTFCPADLELECGDPGNDAAIAAWLLTATATDQCQLDIQVQNNYDPANFTDECGETGSQLVTFTATDDCGNTETCQASIIIRDTQKPYFTFCAADLELQCGDPGNAGAIGGWLNSVTAEDQCDPDVQITDDFDLGRLAGGCSFNTGSLLVTWTATDDCGNTETCQATLTIIDNLKPNFTFCPSDLELECGDPGNDAAIAAWLLTATATDQCQLDIQVRNNYDPANFTDECGETGSQLVTFTATDDCGNQETCQASIIIRDTQKPYFTFCAADLELQCGDPGNAGAIGGWLNSVTAEDQCDPDVQITDDFDLGRLSGGCSFNTGSLLVTWTATDDCGNTEICQATLTIIDNLKPNFTFCPSDLELECGDPGNDAAIAAWLVTATATDQCQLDIQVRNNYDPANFTDECGETGSQLVTFTATDDCGNQETCQASIIIRDTQKPYFTFCAADLELQCGDPGNAGAIGGWLNSVTAEDQCDPDVQITDDFDLGRLAGGCSPNTGSLLVTWTATDDCGNTEICQATLTIIDNLKPVFTNCPTDLDVECSDLPDGRPLDPIGDWLASAAAVDQCDLDVQITNDYDPARFTGGCSDYTGSQLVTWTATDDCGNTETCQATVTIHDTGKPTFTLCPDDLLLSCDGADNAQLIAAWLATAAASDLCDPDVQVTDDYDPANFTGGCGYNTGSQVVTFTATDDCGNFETCTATITISDTESPVCSLPPDQNVFLCAGEAVCLDVSATDNCDPSPVCRVISGKGTIANGQWCYTPDGDEVVTVNVECADACGNTCTGSFTVTIDVNSPPVCQLPNDTTIFVCASERICLGFDGVDPDPGDLVTCVASPNTVGDVSRRDDCTGEDCPQYLWCYTPTQDETIEVTVTCTDKCGATCEGTFVVTFVMNQPPTCSAPAPLEIECGADNTAAVTAWLNSASATDDRGPFTITNNYSPAGFGEGCGNTGSQEVTFTVTDSCGVQVSCTSTITIIDTTAPTCNAPDDLTLSCDDPEKDAKIANWLGSATGDDACGEISVSNNYNIEVFGGCNGTGTQEVTFTVLDACENSATCTAVLTIEDTEAPTCNAPDPLTLECSDPALEDKIGSWLASASGQDNCSAEVSITNDFSYERFEGCSRTGTQVVTFTVIDACENTTECSSTITIEDTEPPTIACPADIDVLCAGDVPPPHAESVVASDACGSVLIEHMGDTQLIEEPPCGGVITRTYRATDECGNFAECQQRIYVILGTPICVVPDDQTVEVCALQGEIRLPVSAIICEAGLTGDQRVQPHDLGGTSSRTTTQKQSNTTITGGTYGKKQADRRHVGGNMAAAVTQGGRCEVYAGPGFIENGEWVGYPAQMGEGPSTVMVRCYDDRCGLFCEETFTVNLIVNPDVNQPPTCTVLNPPNPNPSPCGPFPSPPPPSVSIQGTDPEGGPVTCGLAPGSPGIVTDCVWEPGSWNPGPGTYPITIQCVDTCGAVSETQFTVTIPRQPQQPQCIVPTTSQSYFLCNPGTVTAPVSATGGVGDLTCTVVGGKGSIVGGQWTYNATTDESFTVTVHCVDECGNFCESSFDVDIRLNHPPVCAMPDQHFTGCDIINASAEIQVSDPDDNLSSIRKLSGPGVITNGVWSYTAGVEGTFTVVFEAKDACNAKTQCAFNVTFDLNDPPECNLRDTTITVCDLGDLTLLLNPTDPDLGVRPGEEVTCTLISGPGSIVGNEWYYHLQEYQPVKLTIRCTDACGLYCEKTITVDFVQGVVIELYCDDWQDRTVTLCGPGTFCLDVPPHCGVVLGQGKVEGVNLCFDVQEEGVYWADIVCEDECGNTCTSRAYYTVVFDPSLPECGSSTTSERKTTGGTEVTSAGEPCPCPLRGDLNYDNEVTAEDMSQLAALFTDGRQPAGASADCPALNVADVNCDGALTIQDVQYLAAYLYQGGPAPCTKCASQAASTAAPRPITDLERVVK